MHPRTTIDRENWHPQLETIGVELFLRYRKRLNEPGILFSMRRDYPGLSWLDLWVRLQAGRRLVDSGNDFSALRAVYAGERSPAASPVPSKQRETMRTDNLSRGLVALGELLMLTFSLLVAAAFLSNLATG